MRITDIINHDFCTVLTFHRVNQKVIGNLTPNENLKIEPEQLEIFLSLSRKQGIKFISLDELVHCLKYKEKLRKTAVITLDDGYLDNVLYGSPIFEATSTPYTIYVTTDMPDKKAKLWWLFLEDQILARDSILFDNKEIKLKKHTEKQQFFLGIRTLILQKNHADIIHFLENVFEYKYDYKHYNDTYALSWADICQANTSVLCTIAAHSTSHPNLAQLNAEAAWNEIHQSKLIIEENINSSVDHFAYPFGGPLECTLREFTLAAKAGFKSATTTSRGVVTHNQVQSLMSIPRIEFNTAFSWRKGKVKMLAKTLSKRQKHEQY